MFEPNRKIGIVAPDTAFDENGRKIGGRRGRALLAGLEHHAGQPRRQRQGSEAPSLFSDATLVVERADVLKSRTRRSEDTLRRRIEPRERSRVIGSPLRAIEQQPREICRFDLGLGEGDETLRLRLVPKPVADARLCPAGPATALIRRGARDAYRLQPSDADIRLEARHACEAAVDHDPDAFNGNRGFGDRCRKNDFAASGFRRGDTHDPALRDRERHKAAPRRSTAS